MAIDPGNIESAYCLIDTETLKPEVFGKVANAELLEKIYCFNCSQELQYAIEMIACYGMAVGKEVFDTCVWIGKFSEAITMGAHKPYTFIFRREEKLHICQSPKAKDSNIIQALKDRFGDKGTKASPGFFYGFSKDVWQAYAVGLTFIETRLTV